MQGIPFSQTGGFPVLFGLGVLLVLNPLRARVQHILDRTFFRTRYDFRQTIQTLSQDLTALLDLDEIAQRLVTTVTRALNVASAALYLERIRISFFETPPFCSSLQGGDDGERGSDEGALPGGSGCQDVVQTCAMATTRQRVDKDTFKQIFRDHWEPFQQHQPRYQERHVQAVIDKMLGCGTLEAGYTTYLCPHCLEEKRVAFSCKSSFCLSCCKVYVDEWVAHIGRTLYEGVSYRHVVLTMPDALHLEFYRDRPLLADLMQCGVAMLRDALSWFTQVKLEAGYVVVLETAGRSGHWNPHLHILMTSGGVTPQQKWREVDYFPFQVLHKKWQYHLFTMLKQRVGTRAIKDKIDALWRKYPRGLVAYLEEGKVPAGGEGLAYYLAKYVVSPPISLRRILSYDGQRVRYW